MKIVVASTNPVKIKATEIGFTKMFAGESFEIEGVSVPSGVADKPVSEQETLFGATNRVNNVAKLVPSADYWVGIEGGLEHIENSIEAFAWVVIKSQTGVIGRGRTGSFFLPKK